MSARKPARTETLRGDQKTRQRLLETALRLFAEHGFSKVTVRQISQAADANLAAINYHFGDKLGLYTEVVRSAVDDMRRVSDLSMDAGSARPPRSPEDRLRRYVATYLPRLAKPQGRAASIQKLIRHEMTRLTPLGPWIAEQAIMPRIRYLTTLMAELLACPESDARVGRCVVSLQAQCLFYMRDPMRASIFPDWPPEDDAELKAAAEHIAQLTLAGVAAIRKGSCAQTPAQPASRARRRARD